jgi:hypothetical protein
MRGHHLRTSILVLLLPWVFMGPPALHAEAPGPRAVLADPCPEPKEVAGYYRLLGIQGDLSNPEVGLLALRLITTECRLESHRKNEPLQKLLLELGPALSQAEGLREGAAFFVSHRDWPDFFRGFLRPPLSRPDETGTPSDHYFAGTPNEVIIADPSLPTESQAAFLLRWQATQGVLCALTNSRVQTLRSSQEVFNARLTFILEKGYLQYPWEVALNRGGDQQSYLVLVHPSLAFTLGPVEGKTFRQLREAASTSIQPTLNVSLFGFIRYPLEKSAEGSYTDAYTRYWGITFGIMTGPSEASHPRWGPTLEFHYRAISLGFSRHGTPAGPKQNYLFTTLNLAKYLKLPQP